MIKIGKYKHIDQLLEKYFEGQTSLNEEETLRDYFSRKEIAERHKIYIPMFEFFREERQRVQPKKKKRNLYSWMGAAACIALIITAGVKFQNNSMANRSMMYVDGKRVSDKQEISQQALMSVINITNIDEEAIDAQLSILDMFNGQ